MPHTFPATVALIACLALSACGSAFPAVTASPSPPRAGSGCEELATQGRQVRFGSNIGASLYGVVLGQGRRGVVLAHMNGGDSCQWLGYAHDLSDSGYRVLAFDFAGFGVSPMAPVSLTDEVTAAARFLLGDGTTSVVLMGASMGATAMIAAAPGIASTAAVISLSAPRTFADADAMAGAQRLGVPVLYAAGTDESADYVEAARDLYDVTPLTTPKRLALPHSAEHGVYLVQLGVGPSEFRDEVRQFLADYAPPLR
jgi:pimeloyl-ACP methyl ester carboxylesterase